MKKFLLSLSVALMATAMNAQTLMTAPSQSLKARDLQPKAMNLQMPNELKASIKDFSDLRAKLKKAPAQSDLYGTYVEDDLADIHSCGSAVLQAYEYTDDETGETEEYVELALDPIYTNYECVNYVDVLGIYDEESSTITVPNNQYCYEITSDDYYYSSLGSCYFVLSAIVCDEDGNISGWDDNDLVFDVNEDGSLVLQNDGYYVWIYGESSEYNGYGFNGNTGVILYPANATQSYYWNRPDWASHQEKAYVEDYETSVGVYGFCNVGYCEMTINDDLSVTIDADQPMIDLGLTDESEIDVYGEYLNLYPVEVQNDYLVGVMDGTPIEGTLSGNTISIGGTDVDHQTYFTMYSYLDADEKGYSNGYYVYYQLALDEGNFLADGIKEVNGTREDKIRNTKTYNLMGQQVNRDAAKGLLIRDGKKYIQK